MYSPKIDPDQVRRLYCLKRQRGSTLTALVREALGRYLAEEEGQSQSGCPAQETKTQKEKEKGQ